MGIAKLKFQRIGDEECSLEGQKIDYLCQFLGDEEKLSQTKLVDISARLLDKGILDPQDYQSIGSTSNLSRAKKANTELNAEKVKGIAECLWRIAELYGYQITDFPAPEEENPRIRFKKIARHPELPQEPRSVQLRNFQNNGLTGIVEGFPFENTDFYQQMSQACRLRVIQSAFFSWKNFTDKLEKALKHGALFDVQILLGQPCSEMALFRAHTFGLEQEDQFEFFNSELKHTITSLLKIIENYHGKPKPKTKDRYSIELRLYYRPTSFPIYQCLDRNGKNIFTLLGHFWQDKSSYKKPHLIITGLKGKYLASIDDHFKKIWDDSPKKEELTWRTISGEQKTISVEQGQDLDRLFELFEEGYRLRHFALYKKEKPNWLYFQCYYYNFDEKPRRFLLQIAPKERIAKVTETYNKNTYYGTVTRLDGSYVLFLHTVGFGKRKRIIYLNIPVPIGGLDLRHGTYRLGIYGNNEVKAGSPYSHLILLQRLKNKNEYGAQELQSEVSYIIPILKEKKIDITSALRNFDPNPEKSLGEEYVYHFNDREQDIYYQNLRRELLSAKDEIFFLGESPENFSFSDSKDGTDYFSFLRYLAAERGVTIYRILVTRQVDSSFKKSIRELFKAGILGEKYKLYLTEKDIPFPTNVILIDPEEQKRKRAILSFIKTKKSDGTRRPIRMESIRHDHQIIENLYDTCLEYLNGGSLAKEIKTKKELELLED